MLHDVVEGLCLATGLPMPKLYLVDDRAPNAFSFGRSPERAGIAVTSGLLTVMSRRELEGVLAHEISHIRNGDVQIDTLAVTTVGVLAAGADVFARAAWFPDLDGQEADGFLIVLTLALVAALAAFAARLLSLAVVRHREELADASAAAIVSPTGLRKALEKLEADDTVIDHLSRATSHLWIVTPLQRGGPSRRARTNRLFDSHPPIAERIARLRQLEGLDPDQRGPVDLDSSGHVVDLVWHASVPQAIEPADDAPQFADPGYRSRFVTPKPVLRPPVGKPAGWYHVDAKTLRYWQGVIWLDWYAIWDGARWVHQPPGSARPGDGA
jgi:heat shock protein HtpX